MYPFIHILGRDIASYALFAAAGALLVFAWIFFASRFLGQSPEYCIYAGLIALIGVFLGAHLLYGATNIPNIVYAFKHYGEFDGFWQFARYLLDSVGGMVFYGGLLGGMAAAYIYIKKKKLSLSDFSDIFAPAVPLFHTFGRLGCFFGGCCYGVEWEGGVTFTLSPLTDANGVARLPIQLIEASFNFILFIVLASMFCKKILKRRLFCTYLLCYAPARFIFEFFRGDTLRGIWFGLSTSQWISIFIIAVTLLFLLVPRIHKRKPSRRGLAET